MEYADWINEVQQSRSKNGESLKDLTANWLSHKQEEWVPAPEPKPLEISEADRAIVEAIHWAYWNGAAQSWREQV